MDRQCFVIQRRRECLGSHETDPAASNMCMCACVCVLVVQITHSVFCARIREKDTPPEAGLDLNVEWVRSFVRRSAGLVGP